MVFNTHQLRKQPGLTAQGRLPVVFQCIWDCDTTMILHHESSHSYYQSAVPACKPAQRPQFMQLQQRNMPWLHLVATVCCCSEPRMSSPTSFSRSQHTTTPHAKKPCATNRLTSAYQHHRVSPALCNLQSHVLQQCTAMRMSVSHHECFQIALFHPDVEQVGVQNPDIS